MNKQARWKAPAKYRKAGYSVDAIKLPHTGHAGDTHQQERAQRCRELTREMLRWWEGQDAPLVDPSTWEYLIGRYQSDEFSPFHDVKANTRAGYVQQLRKLEDVLGGSEIAGTTFEVIKTIQKAMEKKGRSRDFTHRFFNTLRRVARYGKMIGRADASVVAEVLGEMRFENSPARQVAPTREQVYAVISEADKEGSQHYALGIMMQYEFGLRAVDVRGQWLQDEAAQGGIIRNGKRWQDGLTWDMIDPELTTLTKQISKTAKSLPEAYQFDLTSAPEIRRRLLEIRPDNPLGPVILARRSGGMPFTIYGWSQAWARLREKAGLPKNVWSMDLRAGAITEAHRLGANQNDLRNAAQHKDGATTGRYLRDRSESANKILRLRQSNS